MRLSNVKFSPQDIELKLSSEIEGSLRQLKPEAGLLTDRYKSFQKRYCSNLKIFRTIRNKFFLFIGVLLNLVAREMYQRGKQRSNIRKKDCGVKLNKSPLHSTCLKYMDFLVSCTQLLSRGK